MSLKEKKINNYADNVKSLSDYPSEDGIGPDELKAIFDGRGDKEIKSSINGIIDELTASTGASQIGSAEGNVQRELDLKVNKESGEVIGTFEVSTWAGDGSVKITPALIGGQAEIKISDGSGSCASLGMDFDGKLTVSYGNEYINEKEAEGVVYSSLSHPYMDLVGVALPEDVRRKVRENLELYDEITTEKLCLSSAEIYKDGDEIILSRPMEGVVPGSALKIGYDLLFNNGMGDYEVYHSGNMKNLTEYGKVLAIDERNIFMQNTGLNEILGDIETALDGIIALQENYIGGESA